MTEGNSNRPNIEVIYSENQIHQRIDALAAEIAKADYRDLLVVAVLKGSFIFAADLIRSLYKAGLSPQVDFLSLSSYRDGTTSTGRVDILRDVDLDVKGRDIILVDDILESGRTLRFAKNLLTERGARRIATCVLLDKPVPRAAEITADFRAFECPDVFVIGYGMDMAYRYRELPFVGQVVD
ncbi:MAG: hypoxanthine phosphoribosyltransferase [Hyphomicrobiaceae bacterium]